MKKKLMDFIPEVDLNSDEGIDEIDDEDLEGDYMNKPVIDARDKSSIHPDLMIKMDLFDKDAPVGKRPMTNLEKDELKDRFDGMSGDERDILITRFNTKELYLELGRRLDKQEAFIDSLGTLVDDYRKED